MRPGHVCALLLAVPTALLAQSLPVGPAVPILEGVWHYGTRTPLERPPDFINKAYLTAEEAAGFLARAKAREQDREAPVAENPLALPFNQFWLDDRDRMTVIDGRILSSRIIDPADGRLPPLTPAAQQRAELQAGRRQADRAETLTDRTLAERCMTPNPLIQPGPEDNVLRIVQSEDYVVLVDERSGVRVVPLTPVPRPGASVVSRTGYSRGRWDGSALLIETTNFSGNYEFTAVDENLRLSERFVLNAPDSLRYEYTVDDPTAFRAPWTAVLVMNKTDRETYEVGCHEGNYALRHILSRP